MAEYRYNNYNKNLTSEKYGQQNYVLTIEDNWLYKSIYSEPCLNRTLNKTESCINQT